MGARWLLGASEAAQVRGAWRVTQPLRPKAGADGLVRASRKPALACRKGPVLANRRWLAGTEPDRAVLSGRTQGIQAQQGINRFSARNKTLLGLDQEQGS
ncbi:MAG TPA: hypothetical protein VFV39_07675, partial [Limnobacter sp.]|nr:hypothetical protein [Limnobacter sp.]